MFISTHINMRLRNYVAWHDAKEACGLRGWRPAYSAKDLVEYFSNACALGMVFW